MCLENLGHMIAHLKPYVMFWGKSCDEWPLKLGGIVAAISNFMGLLPDAAIVGSLTGAVAFCVLACWNKQQVRS
jgi:hypothetical protein